MNAALKILESDFVEKKDNSKQMSREDRKFMQIISDGVRLTEDKHYEMPHLFRDKEQTLPNNKVVAMKRLNLLRKRFRRDHKYKDDYMAFMKEIIDKGYAKEADVNDNEKAPGSVWYIPHHWVYHPRKPGKILTVALDIKVFV